MAQDLLAFRTLNQTFSSIPVKQKIYVFSNDDQLLHQTSRNPQRTRRKKPRQGQLHQGKELHNVWKPTIPSKRLFEQPKFFLSLQRKKFRIINSIKNMSQFCQRSPPISPSKSRKAKEGGLSLRKISSSIQTVDINFQSTPRVGWQPNTKTPYLNFNMQYLLKKRKSMTPNLYKGAEKMGHSSRFQ